jgi:hypothetical protein
LARQAEVHALEIHSYAGSASDCFLQRDGLAIGGARLLGNENNTLSLPPPTDPASTLHGVTLQCTDGLTALRSGPFGFRIVPGRAEADGPSTILLLLLLFALVAAATCSAVATTEYGTAALASASAYMQAAEPSARTRAFIKRRRKWLLKHAEPEDECAPLMLGDLHEALANATDTTQIEQPAWLPRAPDTESLSPSRAQRLLIQKVAGEYGTELVAQAVRASAPQVMDELKQPQPQPQPQVQPQPQPQPQRTNTRPTVDYDTFVCARRSLRSHIDCRRYNAAYVTTAEVLTAANALRAILASGG